jgi:RNA polymerase sigma factor (TIGR02999 family)
VTDVNRLLSALDAGDRQAADQLLPLVYDELRRLAAAKLAQEKPGQTLDATALVHEAYLRLVGNQHFDSRHHFFAAAAEAMRRILVENARRKQRLKHGGQFRRVEEIAVPALTANQDDLLAIDEALTKLAGEDPTAVEVVKLHFYAGLSIEEAAAALKISRATAYRHWTYARAWLRCELESGSPSHFL